MLTPFGLSGLLAGVSSVLFGTLVFLRSPDRRIGQVWFMFTLSCALWGFGNLATSCIPASNPHSALWTWRWVYAFGANWIAPFFFHFVKNFIEDRNRRAVVCHYLIAAVFFMMAFTPLQYADVRWFHDSYYCVGGKLYWLCSSWWLLLIFYSHYVLYRAYRSSSSLKKTQIKFFFFAMAFGFSGGVFDFLPPLGIDIYPWGNFSICIYPFLMSSAILRHRLMDIGLFARDVITKIFTFLLVGMPLLIGRVLAQTLLTWPPAALSRTIGTLAASLIDFSIALSLMRKAENELTNHLIRFFLLLSVWNTGELVLVGSSNAGSVWLYRLAYVVGIFSMLAWYDYWHVYIQGKPRPKDPLTHVLKWSSVAMGSVALFTPWVLARLDFDPHRLRPAMEVAGPGYSIFSFWFLAMVAAIGCSLTLIAMRGKSIAPISRTWLWLAYCNGAVAVLSYFAYVKGLLTVPVHTVLEIAASAAMLGAYLHHPQRAEHSRWIYFGFAATALILPFATGFMLTQGMFWQVGGGLLLVAVVPNLFSSLEASIQAWVDEHIFHGRFSYLSELGEIRKQAFRYINLRDLLESALKRIVDAMRLTTAALYLHDLTSNTFDVVVKHPVATEGRYKSYSEGHDFITTLKGSEWVNTTIDAISHLAIPLRRDEGIFGFFLLGPKEDGSELHEYDKRELMNVLEALQQVVWYTHVFYEQSLMLSKFTHDNLRYAGNIRRTVELIQAGIAGDITPQMRRFSEIIDGEARLLEEYLNDLRQSMAILSQRLRGVYTMKEYDLAELLRQILNSQRSRAVKQQITLVSNLDDKAATANLDFRAWGEIRSIRHAVENLIANAFKFTPAGGTIRLDLKPLGDVLEVSVSDTGMGIPDDELPHIFDLFYQGKGRETMQQSTGLGLSIVKEIVAIHHGNIDVVSEMNRGTTFFVRLPSQTSHIARAA